MKNILAAIILAISWLTGVVVLAGPKVYADPSDPIQKNSVGIEGTIKSNPPTTAATITFPVNGQTFNSIPIKVGGLCTGDLLVKLFKNGVFAGSAQCFNGAYTITIDLFNGTNDLVAKVYDALDQAGPDSATVTVNFVETGFNSNSPRVALSSNYARRGANPDENLSWPLVLTGGTAPYAISVDWGDGSTELVSRAAAGEFSINHKYSSPGVYTIIVKVTDNNGISAFLQLVGVANGALAQDNTQTNAATTTTKTVVVWWPLIIAGGLIIVSFWLGKRHELEGLRRQAEKRITY